MTDYKIKPVSKMTKLLWNAAGADEEMLKKCSYKERVTYFCLGGIVLSTGILAAITGGYAFTFIFSADSTYGIVAAVVFGLFWGYIIYNLDRFIVAAGGKGDGTEKMTSEEFVRALPRLGMAVVIGFTLAAPLELKIFEKEINAEIVQRKGEAMKDYQENILKVNYDNKADEYDSLINSHRTAIKTGLQGINNQIAQKEKDIQMQRQQYNEEARNITVGPRAIAMKEQLNILQVELHNLENRKIALKSDLEDQYSPLIAEAQGKIDKLDLEKAADIAEFKGTLASFDGIAARLEAAHNSPDISDSYLWFIRLLLLVIEITPIMFKMQLVRGAYDYMEENKKYLVMASEGVQIDINYHQGLNGEPVSEQVTFHNVDVKKHALSKETELKKERITKEAERISAENMAI